jgi:hypothetical protein
MRFMVDRRQEGRDFDVLNAATGSIQPLEMPAPAGSHKRSRADFELEGAPAEADSLELLDNLLEEHEEELAARRATKNRALRFMDRDVPKLNLPADVLEGMKKEIGDMQVVEEGISKRIRSLRTRMVRMAAAATTAQTATWLHDLAEGKLYAKHWFDKLYAKYSSAAKVLYLAQPQTPEGFDDLDRDAMMPLLLQAKQVEDAAAAAARAEQNAAAAAARAEQKAAAAAAAARMCEDCGQKHASFGLPRATWTGKKKRWCGSCAKGHEGAVTSFAVMCEDCGQKHASFGVPTETVAPSAPSAAKKTKTKTKTKTMDADRRGMKIRWCAGCAEGHKGALRRLSRAELAKKLASDRRIAAAAAAAAAAVPALAPAPVPPAAVKHEVLKRVKREEGAAAARRAEARHFGAQGADDPPPAKRVKLEVKQEVKQELETAAARTALADTARLVEKRTFQLLAGKSQDK